MVDISIFS